MTRSELINRLARHFTHIPHHDIAHAVKTMIEHMMETLGQGRRIEIRGFGSFALHYHPPRKGRNPKTGERLEIPAKHVVHFKPGKELRERTNHPQER